MYERMYVRERVRKGQFHPRLNPGLHHRDAMHTTLSLVHNVREEKQKGKKKKIENYIFSINPKMW